MATEKPRISSTSITTVPPITIYPDSPDKFRLDSSKYREASNVSISRFNGSNLLGTDSTNIENPEESLIVDESNVPSLANIIMIENVVYLDSTGKAKARVAFNIDNPDNKDIIDVDVRHSESGI